LSGKPLVISVRSVRGIALLTLLLPLACATGGPGEEGLAFLSDGGRDVGGNLFSGEGGSLPLSAHAPAKIVELAAASDHVCAILADGGVFCWGDLVDNVCDEEAGPAWPTARRIPLLSNRGLTKLALASPRCGLTEWGDVLCWGRYIPQVLGTGLADIDSNANCSANSCPTADGAPEQAPCVPPSAVPVHQMNSISAGKAHVCASKVDGSVWCWGWNTILQAYPDVVWSAAFASAHAGALPDYIGPPREVPGVSDAVQVQSSTGSCVLTAGGVAQCWGGDIPPGPPGVVQPNGANLEDYDPAVRQVPLAGVRQVAMADYASFALSQDGSVFTFGFGPGATPIRPRQVADLNGATQLFATAWDDTLGSSGIRAGQYVAALRADGTVMVHQIVVDAVERNAAGAPLAAPDGGYELTLENFVSAIQPGVVPGVSGVRLVAAAEQVLCVVIGDDEVLCEGDNTSGQLGRGTTGDSSDTMEPVMWPAEQEPLQ
jgi:hypothetical protein